MRTTRVTPPPPGSRPSVDSGRPILTERSSTAMRRLAASAISSPPPSAAPLIAATTGRGKVSSLRRLDFIASPIAKISSASSGVALIMLLRLPPAKKVFFALAITTPVTSSCSSWRRCTAASIDAP